LLSLELRIRLTPSGKTTLRDKRKEKGLEPDESYYIKNWKAMNEMDGPFEPTIHPPPDLAVEIDITRRSIPKQPIYAALGVPELWRIDGKHLEVLGLTADGRYERRSESIAFPFLPMKEFERFVLRFGAENDDLAVVAAFQEWVRTLKAG